MLLGEVRAKRGSRTAITRDRNQYAVGVNDLMVVPVIQREGRPKCDCAIKNAKSKPPACDHQLMAVDDVGAGDRILKTCEFSQA